MNQYKIIDTSKIKARIAELENKTVYTHDQMIYENGFIKFLKEILQQAQDIPKQEVSSNWDEIFEEETFDMGGFKLTIKSFGIYHGTEDITDFCHRLFVFYSVIPNKFGKYDCIPNEITFKKTGCENTTTKLSDWLNAYRIYNKLKQKMNNES